MEVLFNHVIDENPNEAPKLSPIGLKAKLSEPDGVNSSLDHVVVLNSHGALMPWETVQARIYQNHLRWRNYTRRDQEMQMLCWWVEILLVGMVFTSTEEFEVNLRPELVMYLDSAEFRGMGITGSDYSNEMNRGYNSAHSLIHGNDGELVREHYANALIVAALYRKNNSIGRFTGTNETRAELASMFFFMSMNDLDTDMRFMLDSVTGNMFAAFGSSTLAEHAVMVSRHNPLGRTVGLGEYPCANESMSNLSMTDLSDEYKHVAAMVISVMQQAARWTSRHSDVDMTGFQHAILAAEQDFYAICKFKNEEFRSWWFNTLAIANRIRINAVGGYQANAALRVASVTLTWWNYMHVHRTSEMTAHNSDSAREAFISTTRAEHLQAGNGDENLTVFFIAGHSILGLDYADIKFDFNSD